MEFVELMAREAQQVPQDKRARMDTKVPMAQLDRKEPQVIRGSKDLRVPEAHRVSRVSQAR
jgi:hypothetical protein